MYTYIFIEFKYNNVVGMCYLERVRSHKSLKMLSPRTCINREKSIIYWPDGIKDERKAMKANRR